jgi:SAM-dependent methyltransferase
MSAHALCAVPSCIAARDRGASAVEYSGLTSVSNESLRSPTVAAARDRSAGVGDARLSLAVPPRRLVRAVDVVLDDPRVVWLLRRPQRRKRPSGEGPAKQHGENQLYDVSIGAKEDQMTLQHKAERLAKETFLGGPVKDFERVGRLQLITLLRAGIYPQSKVLDIGCGCLRGGYWLIHFLAPGHYCGIEPNRTMLEAGLRHLLEPEALRTKQPRFTHDASFDASIFGERFDFFLARSIWTHASKDQIAQMLDSFVLSSAAEAVFLTSYLRARWPILPDYVGSEWVGKSHESSRRGLVFHRFGWIRAECHRRGLRVTELKEERYNGQIWLKITRT